MIYDENPCVDYQKTDELVSLMIERRRSILLRAKNHLTQLEEQQNHNESHQPMIEASQYRPH